ncbi:MAG: hypothetical protein IKL55_04740, partial [Clostridia bacterium]|nr:hypothetical protein [Clostridia bacterium]
MNDTSRGLLDERNNNINSKAMKKDILVRLYQVDNEENATLIRTTKTDEDGLYTFGRDEELDWYDTYNNTIDYSKDTKYQRIDKANNKDENGNYTSDSVYNRYYIEFVYDGVVYKSTDVYAGMKNLKTNNGYFKPLKDGGEYEIDSNATELDKDRKEFNNRYEYISYDIAYDLDLEHDPENGRGGDLVFQKDGHESYLIEDSSRDMTSKSFVLKYETSDVLKACKTAMNSCGSSKWKQCSNHWDDWQVAISMGIIDDSLYPNTTAGRKAAQSYLKSVYNTLQENANDTGDTQMIRYLWLYSFNSSVDRTMPETEYLKYINLGLELREDVDLALTKDVYKLKTTINGEELEYDFNLGDTDEYLNDYIVKQPYGFEIYESDYKYRVEQYISKAVEAYKGTEGEDELNIEVTYRINLKNVATTDDDSIKNAGDTKLDVKVHEVLDLYDQNFEKYGTTLGPVKIKNSEGFLEDKSRVAVEAWIFMKESEVIEGFEKSTEKYSIVKDLEETVDFEEKTYKVNESGIFVVKEKEDETITEEAKKKIKPTFKEDPLGEYVKVKLELSDTSSRGKDVFSDKGNDFAEDGYNSLYIRGMDKITIPEGEDLDIYVKYVVDKDALEITVNEVYNETQTVTKESFNIESKKVETITLENDNMFEVMTNVKTENKTVNGKEETVTTAILERSLKIAEKIKTLFKDLYGRGEENIAQINAYSVWYEDGNPASLVDKDSNAGNIGIKNTSTEESPKDSEYSEEMTSADDFDYYEDMTYKTGIDITAEDTENPPPTPTPTPTP